MATTTSATSVSSNHNITATPRSVPDIIIPSEALPGKVLGTPVWQRRDEGKYIDVIILNFLTPTC